MNPQAGRIVVVGSLNADLTIYTERLPNPGETLHGEGFAVNPGGKSANQAVAAGRLGGNVALIGAVGEDSNGDMLLASVAGAGVDVSRVRRTADAETGVAVITVDAAGENSIVISAGANGTVGPADVAAAKDVFDGAAVVCLCLEVGLDAVEAAAKAGHDAGATVLLNLSPFAPIPQSLAEASDVLLVNAHEASQFLDGAEMPGAAANAAAWEQVRLKFADHGLDRAVVTLSAHGSVVLDSSAEEGRRITRITPTKVNAVDTTGAGDAFTGALAARLAAGETLAEAAAFASVAAALAATKKGTQAAYPRLEDVACLQSRG
ncbi:ribokinase [Arthrobacter sp. VKM Ac-2550]|uniref:ribokinase n=1 Tax=Crystallibacter permensis TaxID=1938888 RepID=UPI0022267331|nr:ribokinase [Arthrobacter sp. VKM Ac-2550]MCW2134571.1 ribokinase [Arthrobacter sp. VKM Ac-2550]